MNAVDIDQWLTEQEASGAFVEILNDLLDAVPEGFDIQMDVWNVLPWSTKPGNRRQLNVCFDVIKHEALRLICKLWVLHTRLTTRACSHPGVQGRITAFKALSYVLGARGIKTLKTDDFNEAERWLSAKYAAGTAHRMARFLQAASDWLSTSFNMRLDYQNRLTHPVVHGRYGTEEGREDKLLPNEVIRDMLESRHRSDLIAMDRFYLPVFAIAVATGFRIGELATLPANCLLKIDGGLHLLHYPEKGGKPVPRPIHPMMAKVVEDAVNQLVEETSEAREVAKQLRKNPQPDWTRIVREPAAFRYFVAKWAHQWTANPNHLLINPNGAWHARRKCFIDAIGAYEAAGRYKSQAAKNLGVDRHTLANLIKTQEAARRGELEPVRNGKARRRKRTSWATDERVLSFSKLGQHCGMALIPQVYEVVRDIIDEAQALQLKGDVYPAPAVDKALEARSLRQVRLLLRDKSGQGILYQDEALLIVQKYALSEHRATKVDDFRSLTKVDISRWLRGVTGSYGTGNDQDSVFNRLGIIDPRTGEIAKFTSHDIRHWLNTIYQNGGLTEDQIALVFNRKYKKQNATYDQTSSKVRTARLKQAVRDKVAVGQVAESYNRIAEFSREDADDYLTAVLRMVNPMPHGVCTLDWATTPCPHHLSCFSCDDEKPCEHLLVEPTNEGTTSELKQVQREANGVVEAITMQGVEDSPTLDHHRRIRRNVGVILDQVRRVQEDSHEEDA